MERREIKVGGFGGQGIILSGLIIGKAAALYSNKSSTLTQAYGPEARGGACSAELVVADGEIHNPFFKEADVMMLMSQEAFTRFIPRLRKGGLALLEEDLIEADGVDRSVRHYSIPATKMAEELGRRIIANIVMLGFFSAMTDVVPKEAMEEAVKIFVPKGTEELNLKAFRAGYEYGIEKYGVRGNSGLKGGK